MPADQAVRVTGALHDLRQQGADTFVYAPDVEDLFFQMEGGGRILESAGEEAGGNLHLARSRNDLDAAMARLTVRSLLLETDDALAALRTTFPPVDRRTRADAHAGAHPYPAGAANDAGALPCVYGPGVGA